VFDFHIDSRCRFAERTVLASALFTQTTLYKPTKCQNVSTAHSGTDSVGGNCEDLTVSSGCQNQSILVRQSGYRGLGLSEVTQTDQRGGRSAAKPQPNDFNHGWDTDFTEEMERMESRKDLQKMEAKRF